MALGSGSAGPVPEPGGAERRRIRFIATKVRSSSPGLWLAIVRGSGDARLRRGSGGIPHQERRALDDAADERGPAIVVPGCLVDDGADSRLVVVLEATAERIG